VRTAGSTIRGILVNNVVDPFDFAQDRFLLIFGGFGCFLAFFVEKCSIFDAFCQLFVISSPAAS